MEVFQTYSLTYGINGNISKYANSQDNPYHMSSVTPSQQIYNFINH